MEHHKHGVPFCIVDGNFERERQNGSSIQSACLSTREWNKKTDDGEGKKKRTSSRVDSPSAVYATQVPSRFKETEVMGVLVMGERGKDRDIGKRMADGEKGRLEARNRDDGGQ
jgi:hypothetical protein